MGARVRRIVLIGLRRSGKTTVGRLVATKTGWAFLDTDAIVTSSSGRSPADWIRVHGIDKFREVERAAVAGLPWSVGAIIATGGGVPLSDENRRALRPGSYVVYLRCDPWTLAARGAAEPDPALRPALGGPPSEEPFVHFAERDALYRAWCDAIVDASRPIADVVAAIVARRDAVVPLPD
jgi:shikimate kinase